MGPFAAAKSPRPGKAQSFFAIPALWRRLGEDVEDGMEVVVEVVEDGMEVAVEDEREAPDGRKRAGKRRLVRDDGEADCAPPARIW
jgi:hypothetical protein